jgi:hypothetical protein
MPSGMWWIGTKQILSFPKSSITQLAMKIANKSIKSFLVLTFAFAHFLWSQDKGEPKPGAIIVLSAKGLVQAIDPAGNVVAGTLKPGAVLAEGYSLKTGFEGEAAMVFSNGSVATVEPRSQVKVSTFLQNSFDGGNQKLSEIQTEPSSSQISLDIDTGSLVVQTKKLDRTSNFTINSPNGTAGIRGTEFQLAVSSTGETKLDVASSTVSFTPSGGDPILVSQGKGVDISNAGAVNQRPIDPVIAVNISTKNAFASNIAGQIPLTTVNQAKEKAAAIAVLSESGANEQEFSGESDEESEEDSDEDSDGSESSSEAAEAFLNNQSNTFRSVPGAQTGSAYYNLVLKLVNGELSPPSVNPGNDPGYEPSLNFTGFKISVDGENLILTLESLVAEKKFVLADESANSIYDYLELVKFEHDKYSNQVLAVGLSAFLKMQKADVLPGVDKINEALSAALDLSTVFLTNVSISSDTDFSFYAINSSNLSKDEISKGKVLNAQNLVDKYKNNDYLFEVGMVLAEYGAFGDNSRATTINQVSAPTRADATEIALNILDLVGRRDLNIPDSVSIGDEGSSGLIDAALLGSTRNDLLDPPGIGQEGVSDSASKKENADRLYKIYLENIYGIVGADITVGGKDEDLIELDVSSVLTKASNYEAKDDDNLGDVSNDKKILALAAARDLIIQSDLRIANDNHAEDHVLVLGAADHVEIYGDGAGAGAKVNESGEIQNIVDKTEIFYEGSNLALGSYSALSLKNVDIDVGGNLAIGSLTDVDIKSSNFSVGRYSDRDNVYLYAENVLKVEGLTFDARPDDLNERFESGTAREIYMEATTIDLKDVYFPANSEVMLRSEIGEPFFYGYPDTDRKPGAVNFYKDSNKYGNIPITSTTFTTSPNANPVDGSHTGYNSIGESFKTSTGDAGIKIRQFPK